MKDDSRNMWMKLFFFSLLVWIGVFFLLIFLDQYFSLSEEEALFFSHLACFSVSCPVLYLLIRLHLPRYLVTGLIVPLFLVNIVTVWWQIWSLSSLAMLLCCGLLGIFFAALISSRDVLFIIVVLVGMIDIIGVTLFIVTENITHNPVLLHMMCIHFPLPGFREIRPVIGFADFVFFSLFLRAAHRFEFSLPGTFRALFSGLVMALFCAWLFDLFIVAVLPYLAVFFLIFNRHHFSWSGKTFRHSLRVIGLCSLVFLIVALLTR